MIPCHSFRFRIAGSTHVRVIDGLDANAVKDGLVVRPCGVTDMHRAVAAAASIIIKAREEDCAQMICARSADRLDRCHAVLGDGGRIFAQDQFSGGRGEVGETGDGEVFVVH